ncbi:MAG TPA: hypothetical protein VI980_08400 [Acidimicrobiia bacterium]|nr:hypothetical protein [Acidimicrobiia bacterium]
MEAIESSDTDELLRVVDGLCSAQAWDGLVELRARCREAVTRGKQVWGVEEHIRYRLALEGPPSYAGPTVSEGQSRFALGPLPEVAASTKTWREMEPYLEAGPERRTLAAERVVRGERVSEPNLDLPGALEDWEPIYPVATYKRDMVEAPTPPPPDPSDVALPSGFEVVDDPQSEAALADLVLPWTDESNGRCQTTVVAGDHLAAIRSLGATVGRSAAIGAAAGLAWMGWAAASGGAHGRRRGAAAGRHLAWWATSVMADLRWPCSPEDLGSAASRFGWFWFDDGSPGTGWALRLAIEDPDTGLSWAISAVDLV